MVLILITMAFQAFTFRGLMEEQLLFTFVVLTGILILQIILLFQYLRKTNRLLTKLVLAISNQDFTLKLGKTKRKTPYKEFSQALNSIVEKYQSVYMAIESQSFLMHHLIQAIPAGIMVTDQDGEVVLMNHVMENLLTLKGIKSLDEMIGIQPELYQKILKPGIPGVYIYELAYPDELKKLSVSVNEFLLLNSMHKIILVKDISKEVDAGEVDAIQRLLRILTHEIMNSLTPIHSLTETITMLITDGKGQPKKLGHLRQKNYNDILESVQAIQERTGKLDHFVNRFRTLTRLPESLKTEIIPVRDLFESACKIMHSQLSEVEVIQDPGSEELRIAVDAAMIEQVIINLITNSITAMSDTRFPRLTLRAFSDDDHIVIQVHDNGKGIPTEKLADIFLPFYSTKEQASGIGLSFVKQIITLHNASIHVQSQVGQGSSFFMKFQPV